MAQSAGAQRNDAKTFGIEWYEGERTIEDFYDSDITSYDYQAPISEAGAYGQPGSGGPNKFEASRLHPFPRVFDSTVCRELPASSHSPGSGYSHGRKSVHAMSCNAWSFRKPLGQRGSISCLQEGIACMRPCAGMCSAVQGIRNAIMAHTNQTLPDPPPQPRIVAYGDVALTQQATLLDSLGDLFPGLGIYSQVPMPMEEYGQG